MSLASTKSVLLFFLCLTAAIVVRAHTGSCRGVIYDGNSQKPLEASSIFIKQTNASALTDVFGKFLVKDLKPGRYQVVISHIAYETSYEEIVVEDGMTTDMSIHLLPSSVNIKEVSINARKDLNLSAISGLDLKSRPQNSTQDLMRLVPGLFTSQHQGGGKAEQLFLRGFDADHGTDINVSVDGMPVNMVSHAHGQGYADTHFIIPEAIQEMDFGKGPYRIDKGNLATAGWVEFKTRNSLDKSFVKVEGGSYGYFRTAAGYNLLDRTMGNNKQEAYIIGEYGSDRGYFDAPQNFNRYNLMAKYTNYLSPNKILSLTLSGFGTTWDASGQIPTRAVTSGLIDRWGSLDGEGGQTSRYNANLQYFQSVNTNIYIKSNIYLSYYTFKLYSDFTYFLVDSNHGDQIRQAEKCVLAGYNTEYTNNYKLGAFRMKTQSGIGMRYDDIMNDELSHTMDKSLTLGNIALGDIHETNFYGYANQTVYLLPQLVLTAGTRFDYFIQQYYNKLAPQENNRSSVYNNSAFSPKAGIYYNFSDKARIYYNYGIGFHSNDTRTLAVGQDLAQPVIGKVLPRAYSQDLGIIFKQLDKLLVSAAIWQLDLQQEFTYNGDESNVQVAGATRRQGIDLSVRYQLFRWLYLDADANIAKARFVDSASGHNYLPLAPGFTSVAGATFKINNYLSTGFRFRHMADRPATSDGKIVTQGYSIFDAVLNYIRPKYEFGLQVQNLFNTQWQEAAFATETRLPNEVATHIPGTTDLCFTPGTPLFIKISATYKF